MFGWARTGVFHCFSLIPWSTGVLLCTGVPVLKRLGSPMLQRSWAKPCRQRLAKSRLPKHQQLHQQHQHHRWSRRSCSSVLNVLREGQGYMYYIYNIYIYIYELIFELADIGWCWPILVNIIQVFLWKFWGLSRFKVVVAIPHIPGRMMSLSLLLTATNQRNRRIEMKFLLCSDLQTVLFHNRLPQNLMVDIYFFPP